jgi:hypothetical protein
MVCTADLVAAYIPPHGRGLDRGKFAFSSVNKSGQWARAAAVPLCDDGANGYEHPLLTSGHVREHCSIHPENRKNVRVKGSLYLFER